jgi:presenilin-like A22 family membrane protease
MDAKTKAIDIFPMFVMGGLFVLVNLLAFWVTGPFEAAGEVAYIGSGPGDFSNVLFFFTVLIIFTAIVLIIAKLGKERIIQAIFLGSVGILGIYVFYPLLGYAFPWQISLGLSAVIMAGIVGLLIKFPEWYVIDITGIVIAVGAVAMLGISLTVLIALVLLVGMALYDAISVYKTKHMIDLADTLIDLKLPILFVIPKTRSYSLVKETKGLKEKLKDGEKRDAFFMGVGDIVIPGILAAASFYYGVVNNIPEIGLAMGLSVTAGTLLGFVFLMTFVIKGKPQAGLPFLCPGAILGYVISSLMLTGTLAGL